VGHTKVAERESLKSGAFMGGVGCLLSRRAKSSRSCTLLMQLWTCCTRQCLVVLGSVALVQAFGTGMHDGLIGWATWLLGTGVGLTGVPTGWLASRFPQGWD